MTIPLKENSKNCWDLSSFLLWTLLSALMNSLFTRTKTLTQLKIRFTIGRGVKLPKALGGCSFSSWKLIKYSYPVVSAQKEIEHISFLTWLIDLDLYSKCGAVIFKTVIRSDCGWIQHFHWNNHTFRGLVNSLWVKENPKVSVWGVQGHLQAFIRKCI